MLPRPSNAAQGPLDTLAAGLKLGLHNTALQTKGRHMAAMWSLHSSICAAEDGCHYFLVDPFAPTACRTAHLRMMGPEATAHPGGGATMVSELSCIHSTFSAVPVRQLTCASLGRRPQEHQLRGWHRESRWPQSSLGRRAGPAGSEQHEGALQDGGEVVTNMKEHCKMAGGESSLFTKLPSRTKGLFLAPATGPGNAC